MSGARGREIGRRLLEVTRSARIFVDAAVSLNDWLDAARLPRAAAAKNQKVVDRANVSLDTEVSGAVKARVSLSGLYEVERAAAVLKRALGCRAGIKGLKHDALADLGSQAVGELQALRWAGIRAKDKVLAAHHDDIQALPLDLDTRDARGFYFRLVGRLTFAGAPWSAASDLKESGRVFDLLARRATRQRFSDRAQAFRVRFGFCTQSGTFRNLSYLEVLNWSPNKLPNVLEYKRAKWVQTDAAKVLNRAKAISAIKPTTRALELALVASLCERFDGSKLPKQTQTE